MASGFPRVLVDALFASIRDERSAPTLSEMREKLLAVRATRRFDESDSTIVGVIEPSYSDTQKRAADRVRRRADDALRNLPSGRGNRRYYPRSNGIDSATLCALMVSVKLDWPGVTNRQAQAFSEGLYAKAGGDVERRGGTPNQTDGFWRDHLRAARKWRNSPIAHVIERTISCSVQ